MRQELSEDVPSNFTQGATVQGTQQIRPTVSEFKYPLCGCFDKDTSKRDLFLACCCQCLPFSNTWRKAKLYVHVYKNTTNEGARKKAKLSALLMLVIMGILVTTSWVFYLLGGYYNQKADTIILDKTHGVLSWDRTYIVTDSLSDNDYAKMKDTSASDAIIDGENAVEYDAWGAVIDLPELNYVDFRHKDLSADDYIKINKFFTYSAYCATVMLLVGLIKLCYDFKLRLLVQRARNFDDPNRVGFYDCVNVCCCPSLALLQASKEMKYHDKMNRGLLDAEGYKVSL